MCLYVGLSDLNIRARMDFGWCGGAALGVESGLADRVDFLARRGSFRLRGPDYPELLCCQQAPEGWIARAARA